MKRAILSAALAVAFVTGVFAQDTAKFAGKWKSDTSYNVYTITVVGSRMTITTTVAGNTSEPMEYMLDGTMVKKTSEGPNGPVESVRTSTWEGHVLVTTTKLSNGSVTVERRSLEPDGTMRVQNTLVLMQGKPAPPSAPTGVVVMKKIG